MYILRTLRNALLATSLATLALMAAPATAHAGVFVSVAVAPPAIPVYAQPLCPGDGYIWTPGYWAYGDDGYGSDAYAGMGNFNLAEILGSGSEASAGAGSYDFAGVLGEMLTATATGASNLFDFMPTL